jgi:GMP synthase-like glutamine amidotransferase
VSEPRRANHGHSSEPRRSEARILVLQHEPSDGPLLLGDWLRAAGAELVVLRLYDSEEIPDTLDGVDGLVSLGGEMGANDDDVAPWLPATRALLASAVQRAVPTLGICLGGQLLAAATGGTVQRAADGPEIGAYLTAKRDAAADDPLFRDLPMTPDVVHYHQDVISTLPPHAVLLLSSMGYPHQAFRVGPCAWGLQFHIEAPAETVRDWARTENLPIAGRLGPPLDDAVANMAEVWSEFAARFVEFTRTPPSGPGLRRLPLLGSPS